MSDKVKESLLDVFIKGLKAQNSADGKEPEKEPEKPAENKKACNEDVDKRKLIDEVGGILKGKVDDEIIRTIIGKLEKVAYDKSEAGTANNCNGKQAKNEEEPPKEEPKKEDKPAENGKAKNEDDDKEKKEFEKAQNSLDDVKKLFYQGKYTNPKPYMTQKQGIELGRKLY